MEYQAQSVEVLTNVTGLVASEALELAADSKFVQVKGSTTTGVGSATIIGEVTNDLTWPWVQNGMQTLTLGTAEVSDVLQIDGAWKYCRLRVTAISGTGAKVSANLTI